MRIKSNRGFTLIELLLYVTIAGVVLLALSVLLSLLMQIRIKNEVITEVDQEGALVMQSITQTIRNATSITSPVLGTTGTSLTLVVPTGTNSPTVFDLSSGVVRIKEGAGSVVSLTSSKVLVSSLSFQNAGRSGTNGSIKIQYTVTYNSVSNRQEYTFSRTFYGTASIR